MPAKDLIGSRTVGGHKFVQLLSSETHDGTDFQYRVMPVATGESDMKAALVKADSVNKGYVAVSNVWLSAESITTVGELNADGANGLPRWQSYVLGLDPSKAGDKPYLVPIQTAEAGKMDVGLGGTRPGNSATGVKYAVVECDAVDGSVDGAAADTAPDATTEETLPGSVKYYRLKLELTPDPLNSGEE